MISTVGFRYSSAEQSPGSAVGEEECVQIALIFQCCSDRENRAADWRDYWSASLILNELISALNQPSGNDSPFRPGRSLLYQTALSPSSHAR